LPQRPGDPPILFLDIDGVLLRRRHSGMFDAYELAPHCLEFLEWATIRFRCRWLSSRCRQGFLDGSHRAFRQAGGSLSDPRWQVLHLLEPLRGLPKRSRRLIRHRISGGLMMIRQTTAATGFARMVAKIA
jgi:hypothetical protein